MKDLLDDNKDLNSKQSPTKANPQRTLSKVLLGLGAVLLISGICFGSGIEIGCLILLASMILYKKSS